MSELRSTPKAGQPKLDGTALAWKLATAVRPHISTAQAHDIHIAIGIGEIFDAIDVLITVLTRQQIALDPTLIITANSWLDRYLGQPAEPRLRALLAEMKALRPPPTR